MNRIGWFVVCLVVAAAIPRSLADGSHIKNQPDFKNATNLKPKVEYIDSALSLLRQFFREFLRWGTKVQEHTNEGGSRTFGQKRVQFMMLGPMMYKMGVMMTMLIMLTVISMKGLVIGAILLILKLSSFLAKFHSGWHPQGHGQAWPHQQPFHVHVHGYQAHNHAYSGWSPDSDTIGPEEHYYYKG